ncbi:Hypothetical protein CINCED_3A013303 [Cinara cedri]|uniref:CUB domain-containing protein n=1 Tax=Cinara cedri TaxID=506608 RepID=A0A5E4NLZ5_9HEMI|nr:Hypothetical protein CINCED_3A013303 [Cinara cedri]
MAYLPAVLSKLKLVYIKTILKEPNRLEHNICISNDDSKLTGECVSSTKCKLHGRISGWVIQFVVFVTAGVNSGYCDTDSFTVTEGEPRNFTICGSYDGKHLYYNIHNNTEDSIMPTSTGYEISFTQIGSMEQTPSRCINYHKDTEGTLQMMDFKVNGQYLAHKNYWICIQLVKDVCSVLYQKCEKYSTKINRPVLPGYPNITVIRMPYTNDDKKRNPEDYLGLCFTYKQLVCLP